MTNKYLEKMAGSFLANFSGRKMRNLDKLISKHKYKAVRGGDPTKKVDRLIIKRDRAQQQHLDSRRFLPESLIEGAAKAAPGAAIAAVSGYLIGRKKEKDAEKATSVK